MTEIDKIVKKFLSSLPPFIRDNILSVIVYGSRIQKNNRPDSDLDILIIIDGNNNYRIGKIIDSLRCDATVYSFNNIYDIIEAKNNANNQYFHSVFNHGYIYEDKIYLIPTLKDYLETPSSYRNPRKISNNDLFELKSLYEEFSSLNTDFYYYNLLEKIRTIYHYKGHFSYIGLTKVAKAYEESAFYTSNYHLHLPSSNFRNLFLNAIYSKKDERLPKIQSLLGYLDLPAFLPAEPSLYNSRYYNSEDIKYSLLIFTNRLNELKRLCNTQYFPYIFNVTLKQLYTFCQDINVIDETVEKLFASASDASSTPEQLKILYHILASIGTNYHFDYDDYMIKLKR